MTVYHRDDPENKPFSYTMKEETEERYEKMAQRLVRFAIRVFEVEDAPIKANFSELQAQSLQRLINLLPSTQQHVQPRIITAYHDVLKSLFFSIHPLIDTLVHEDPISIFLICTNITDNMCNFKPPGAIATTCSTLLHIMRLAAVKEIDGLRQVDNRPDATLK
jgi:hypothetical protein